MNLRGKLLIIALCLGLSVWTQAQSLLPLPTSRNDWVEKKITAPNPNTEENFGYAVAINGDGSTILVGAKDRSGGRGAALVYVRTGDLWTLQQEIFLAEGTTVDQFGFSVALSRDGSTAVIGTYGTNSVYLYTRTNAQWTLTKQFTENKLPADRYGNSIALNPQGDLLLIGATGEQNGYGKVYPYRLMNGVWTPQPSIALPANPYPLYSGFGYSLAVSGSTALISAIRYGKNDVLFPYHYNGEQWVQQPMLQGEDDTETDRYDYFGWSLALDNSGTIALVSEWGADEFQTYSGVVHVYRKQGEVWVWQQKIVLANPTPYDSFGWSLDLSDDGSKALISAVGQGSGRGAVYLYKYNGSTWEEKYPFFASDGAAPDAFGSSVALNSDGKIALIGARGDALVSGSVYIYENAQAGVPSETPTGEVPQTTTTPTPPGPNVPVNYVNNDSFEEVDPIGQPLGWKLKGGTKNKILCKNANSGNCAFRFKGEASKLTQKIKLGNVNFLPGDQLKLNLFASTDSLQIDARVEVRVRYADDTGPSETTIFLTQTTGYMPFNGEVTLSSGAVKNIRVQVQYAGGGKLWLDDLTLLRK